MQKLVMSLFVILIFSCPTLYTFADEGIDQYKRTKAKKLVNPKLQLDVETIFFDGAGTYVNDIVYRKKYLPGEQNNQNEILVLPSSGLVIPILETVENVTFDQLLINGLEVDFNKYLQHGSVKFTKETNYGAFGNISIFGHSSYWKDDEGKYKTHFQKIIELDIGDEIWIYRKMSDGHYKRYIYITSLFYETNPENISILENIKQQKKLTLFTCTSIGGVSGRWIVEALFDEDTARKNLTNSELLTIHYIVGKIAQKNNKDELIISILQKIHSFKTQISFLEESQYRERKYNLLHVLEEELRRMY